MENHMQQTSSRIEYVKFFALIIAILLGAFLLSNNVLSMDYMRSVMAVFFVVFALFQLLGYKSFVHMFKEYDPIAQRAKIYSYAYPFIGLGLGFLYLFDLFIPWRDVITAIIMLVGAYGVWKTIRQKRSEIHCACLGNIIKLPLSTITLTEDVAMGIMALGMLFTHFL